MNTSEILKKIRQIEIRASRLANGECFPRSFQPPTKLEGIPTAVPYGKHSDLAGFRVDGEINRVRPAENLCLSRQTTGKRKALRLCGQSLKNCMNFIVEPQAEARFALLIPINGPVPIPFGLGIGDDAERHFLAWKRSRISARTCSAGFPRPGFFRASSARRSSSAICSGLNSSSNSGNSSRMRSTTSQRSTGGKARICSMISAALTWLIYPYCPSKQAGVSNGRRLKFQLQASLRETMTDRLKAELQTAPAPHGRSRITHHASRRP